MFKHIKINELSSVNPNTMNLLLCCSVALVLFNFYVYKNSQANFVLWILYFTAWCSIVFIISYMKCYSKMTVFKKVENMTLGELKQYYALMKSGKTRYGVNSLKKMEVGVILSDLARYAYFSNPELLYSKLGVSYFVESEYNGGQSFRSKDGRVYINILDEVMAINDYDNLKIKDFHKLNNSN